jgi:hypothetical protein
MSLRAGAGISRCWGVTVTLTGNFPSPFQPQDHRGHLDGLGPGAEDDQDFFQYCLVERDLMKSDYPLHTRLLRTAEDMPGPNRAEAAIKSQLSLNQAIACFRPSSKGVLGW